MMSFTTETPLALNDAASFMGVHRRTVENWIKRGLECRKVGRLIYTTREAIDRFAVQPVEEQPAAVQQSSENKECLRRMKERFGF